MKSSRAFFFFAGGRLAAGFLDATTGFLATGACLGGAACVCVCGGGGVGAFLERSSKERIVVALGLASSNLRIVEGLSRAWLAARARRGGLSPKARTAFVCACVVGFAIAGPLSSSDAARGRRWWSPSPAGGGFWSAAALAK